jgi:hypothetical protein
MPFFDWNTDSVSQAANSNFWIYWAVTGPLTLATMCVVVFWAVWRYKKTERLRKEARESSVLGNNNSESNCYFEKGRSQSHISVAAIDPAQEEERTEKVKQAFEMPNFMKRMRQDSYRRSDVRTSFKTRRASPPGRKASLARPNWLMRRNTFDSMEIARGPPPVRRGTHLSTISEMAKRGTKKQSTFNTVDIP